MQTTEQIIKNIDGAIKNGGRFTTYRPAPGVDLSQVTKETLPSSLDTIAPFKPSRAKFSDQRPYESQLQYELRMTGRRIRDAKRKEESRSMRRRGTALLAHAAIEQSKIDASLAVSADKHTTVAQLADLALSGKLSMSMALRLQNRPTVPAVLDANVAIAEAMQSRTVLGTVNGRIDETTGEVYVHDVRPCDMSERDKNALRLYLAAKFSPENRGAIGKVKNNFVSLNSNYARNIRFFNLVKAHQNTVNTSLLSSLPYCDLRTRVVHNVGVSPAIPQTVQMLSYLPYSDIKTRKVYNWRAATIRTDRVVLPITREQSMSPKPSALVTYRWTRLDRSTERLVTGRRISTPLTVAIKSKGKITEYAAFGSTPIAVELAELRARAGFSYSAVLASDTRKRLPKTVTTGQVTMTAQYALGRADGVFSVYPRPSTLR